VGYAGTKEAIPKVTPKDLHWVCRHGECPIIIDARPKQEHESFHIMGSINIPLDTFVPEDIADIPRDRPVYVHSGKDSESLAVKLAQKLSALPHPRVSIVIGGPDVIRGGGFLYYQDTAKYDKVLLEKKLLKAAEEAKKKQEREKK